MSVTDLARLAYNFARTRWFTRFNNRAELEVWQAKKISQFLRKQLTLTPYYQSYIGCNLPQLPMIDKSVMLKSFEQLNSAGITLDHASKVALASENSRDFLPTLDGYTVGLSSGTQGPRGVFLTSQKERAKWAGIMMARALPSDMMRKLFFWKAPIKIAFFLRANSNLYTALKSKRIDFSFYDLFAGVQAHIAALEKQAPDILVAPAHVLSRLAELKLNGSLTLKPQRVISVAEVLEPDDKARIEAAFGGVVHQLYQCTEGFLAYTCELGVLHLNEEFVHVEPEWLDEERTRFVPIVTDFTRTTQKIIRYRLNDVLRVCETPCDCGRVSLALAAIEGRCDDVLWLPHQDSKELTAIYPDMLRHAITIATLALPDYRIAQHGLALHIAMQDEGARSAMINALSKLIDRHGLEMPIFKPMPFIPTDDHAKRRRIICVERPVLDNTSLSDSKTEEASHA